MITRHLSNNKLVGQISNLLRELALIKKEKKNTNKPVENSIVEGFQSFWYFSLASTRERSVCLQEVSLDR